MTEMDSMNRFITELPSITIEDNHNCSANYWERALLADYWSVFKTQVAGTSPVRGVYQGLQEQNVVLQKDLRLVYSENELGSDPNLF